MLTQFSEKCQKAFELTNEYNRTEQEIIELQKLIQYYHERFDYIEREQVLLEVASMFFAKSILLKEKQLRLKELKKELADYEGLPTTITQLVYPTLRGTRIIQLILDQPGMFKVGRLVCKEWNEYLISKVRPNIVLPELFAKTWYDWPVKIRSPGWHEPQPFRLPYGSQQFYDFVVKCILAHGCGHNITLTNMYVNGIMLFEKPLGRAWHFVDYIVPEHLVNTTIDKLKFDDMHKYLPPGEIWEAMQQGTQK